MHSDRHGTVIEIWLDLNRFGLAEIATERSYRFDYIDIDFDDFRRPWKCHRALIGFEQILMI